MSPTPLEDSVLAALRALPADKQQEVLDFASYLVQREKRPLKSLYGVLAGHGIAVSDDDIIEIRKEMWANFPRDL